MRRRRIGWLSQLSAKHQPPSCLSWASRRGEAAAGLALQAYSDIGLSEMSQSLPVKVEMKSVFIGV